MHGDIWHMCQFDFQVDGEKMQKRKLNLQDYKNYLEAVQLENKKHHLEKIQADSLKELVKKINKYEKATKI